MYHVGAPRASGRCHEVLGRFNIRLTYTKGNDNVLGDVLGTS